MAVARRNLPEPKRLRRFALALMIAALGAATLAAAPEAAAAKVRHKTAARHADKAETHGFEAFVASLWPLARARGVSRATFEAAFAGVTFDSRVVAHTKKQAEFQLPVWRYLAAAVSPARVERGREKAAAEQAWLAKARTTYGVDESIVLGVWGVETDYGGFPGGDNVIRSLASLAYVHFRGDYFRNELIAALAILQEGDIEPRAMKGSWAGAMGQTQFMPSSFLEYAVDFEGHGRRDIWTSPPDAIGSTANYLAKHGWRPGLPWGFEVRLPDGFALADADSSRAAPFSAFVSRGLVRADGAALPPSGEGRLFMPAGLHGPVFLITPNFDVIKSYNNSSSYALAVALLGDAADYGRGIVTRWPVHDPPPGAAEVRRLQQKLKSLGYQVGDIDGMVGESLRAAVRAYQEDHGLPPDGYANLALARRVGAGR